MLGKMVGASARRFSGNVVKYAGRNTNITAHNPELREGINDSTSSFVRSFNMGYESFSTPVRMHQMHPVLGNRGEYFVLALLLPIAILLKSSRKKNEDGIRSELGNATNRYAYFATAAPSEW